MNPEKRSARGFKWGSLLLPVTFLTLVVFLGLGGCSQNPANTGTESYDVDAALQALNFVGSPEMSPGKDDDSSPSETGWILVDFCSQADDFDEDGGNLDLELDDKDIEFTVLKGALTQEVEISIRAWKYATEFGDVYIYECSPDGLEFEEPIQVKQAVDKPDGKSYGLFYDNPAFNAWQLEQVSPVKSGKVEFEIHHFSKYGIS